MIMRDHRVRTINFALLHGAILTRSATALSSFTPNCTFPPEGTSYVGAPPVRSTLDIVWSSLSIIILCTWNILHLNVPSQRPAASFWRKTWWKIIDSRKKIKWMIFTMLAPEFILVLSVDDFVAAYEFDRPKKERSGRIVRNYLANMGYFVLDTGNRVESSLEEQGHIAHDLSKISSQEVSKAIATIQPQLEIESQRANLCCLEYRYWALNARQWEVLQHSGLAELPDIPENELERIDSAGGLLRLLAILQICWLIIQLTARQVQGYTTSQLEIGALAFAAQSVLTWLVNWNKPHNVQAIHVIRPLRWQLRSARFVGELEELIKALVEAGPDCYGFRLVSVSDTIRFDGPSPVPNDSAHHKRSGSLMRWGFTEGAATLATGGLIFGSFHLLAWNSTFANASEAIAWKVSAFLVMFGPAAITMLDLLPAKMKTIDEFGTQFVACMYVLARLFLVVEMFRTLAYLPPDAYKQTWPQSLPHWG